MKRLLAITLFITGAYILMLTPSCDYGYVEPVIIDIPDTVSFSNDIIPIFNNNCNESGCHSTGGIAPDLTPQNAYFELWLYGMVDTANAESSTLYIRMASTSNPMPPTGKLTDDKVQLVLAWIEQGALDN